MGYSESSPSQSGCALNLTNFSPYFNPCEGFSVALLSSAEKIRALSNEFSRMNAQLVVRLK